MDRNHIRFAISPKSPVIENIKQDPNIQLLVTLTDNVRAIKGKARVLLETIPEVSFPMTCIEVIINGSEDIMFYGGRLVSEPKYEKTYSVDLSKKLDTAIYKTLRNKQEYEEVYYEAEKN